MGTCLFIRFGESILFLETDLVYGHMAPQKNGEPEVATAINSF